MIRFGVGTGLLVVGTVLRVAAQRELARVGITGLALAHPIRPAAWTDRGPYALLRHPLYWGSLATIAGVGILALGPGGAALALAAFPFYQRRMVEEDALRRQTPASGWSAFARDVSAWGAHGEPR